MARTQQETIVAQSQLKLTLDYFQMCGVCPTLADMIKVSTMLEKFIRDGYSTQLMESFSRIDDYIELQYKTENSPRHFEKTLNPEETKNRIQDLMNKRKDSEKG